MKTRNESYPLTTSSAARRLRLALGTSFLLAIGLAPSCSFAAEESATVGQALTDTAISTKVRAALLTDSRIKKSSITVHTTNGVVTLTGKAASDDIRTSAEFIASHESGVVGVDNQLTIATVPTLGDKAGHAAKTVGHSVEHAASETGEVVSDSYITSKVKSQLLAAKGVSSAGIEVTTVDGVVTLSGHVPKASEQAKAIRIAQRTHGVKKVESANLAVVAE